MFSANLHTIMNYSHFTDYDVLASRPCQKHKLFKTEINRKRDSVFET
jgi:hypothetical protein